MPKLTCPLLAMMDEIVPWLVCFIALRVITRFTVHGLADALRVHVHVYAKPSFDLVPSLLFSLSAAIDLLLPGLCRAVSSHLASDPEPAEATI